MRKYTLGIVGLLLLTEAAHAAGERAILKFKVDETKLSGYVAAPPNGWAPTYLWGAVTPSTATPQQIYALTLEGYTTFASSTVPDPAILNILSEGSTPTGYTIAGSYALPVQVTAADCSQSNCPNLNVIIAPAPMLKNRLQVGIYKTLFGANPTTSFWLYFFDPSATSTSEQWFLAAQQTGVSTSNFSFFYNNLVYGSTAGTDVYVFNAPSAALMDVTQIVTK
jgi:hypothetical protein